MATTFGQAGEFSFTAFYGGDQRGRCLQILRLTPQGHPYQEYTAKDVKELRRELGRSGEATISWKEGTVALSEDVARAFRSALRTWEQRSYDPS